MNLDGTATCLEALGNPTRLAVFRLLVEGACRRIDREVWSLEWTPECRREHDAVLGFGGIGQQEQSVETLPVVLCRWVVLIVDPAQEAVDGPVPVVALPPELVVPFGEPLAGGEDVSFQFLDIGRAAKKGVNDLLGCF